MTVAVLTEGYGIDPANRRAYRDAFWAGYGDPPSGRARWQCYELLARVRLARHLGTEMAGTDDGAVSARISDHTGAFRELLDGDSRFERSPNAT